MAIIFRLPTSLGVAVAIVLSAAAPVMSKPDDIPAIKNATAAENAAPLYRQAIDQIASPPHAVALLRMAASKPRCDWPQQYELAEVTTLGKLRELSSMMLDHARRNIEQQRYEEATRDLLAVTALGKHIGQTPLAIAKLVEVGIVASAIEEFARVLPDLPKDVIARLSAQLEALPRSATPSEMILGEYAYARDLVRRGEAFGWNDDAIVAAKPFYDQLAAAAQRAPDAFAATVDAKLAALPTDQVFAKTIAPALKPMRVPIAKVEALEAMLKTAAAIVAGGADAAKQSRDPFGAGPFQYQTASNPLGFELSSKLVAQGRPVKLRIGSTATR